MSSDTLSTGLPPTNDRMLTTCFIAALIHGIIILGVTFAPSRNESGSDSQALEVVLVNDQAPAVAKNPNARYIAQRTQLGTGNTQKGRTTIPTSSPVAVESLGIPGGDGLVAKQAGTSLGEEEVVATHAPALRILYFASTTAAPEAARGLPLLEKKLDLGMMPNDDGIELRMRGEAKQQLWVAADTRESDVAVYLDSWRRKIERVGTLNFPDAARRKKLSGTPVIEVTIGADGKLLRTVVRRTSGHAEIDDAAMRILKLAAPYDRFPSALGAKHDQIRIAYEWQFLGGAAQGSSVFYAEPSPSDGAPSDVALGTAPPGTAP